MKTRDLSKALHESFSSEIAKYGFHEIDASCIYARRLPEILQVVVCDVSRHGPHFRISVYGWIPEFILPGEENSKFSKHLTQSFAQERHVSSYSLGATKWWGCATVTEARESGRSAVPAFLRGALPWFSEVSTLAALERALIPNVPETVAARLASGVRTTLPASAQDLPIWTADSAPINLAL